jgi:pyrroline-5-carboxylate reductase
MSGPRIGIIGIGRLGEAIASAVLALPGPGAVPVSRRNAGRVEALCRQDPRVRADEPAAIVASCDVVIVALRPDAARQLLPSLAFEPRHTVISTMAEIGLDALRGLAPGAGGHSRLLAMPSVAQGGQLLPVYPASAAVEELFGGRNTLLPVETEAQLMTLWAITGLLSTVMTVGDVAARWLEEAGIARAQATAYTRTLFSDVHAATEPGFTAGLDHVSTPGGLNVMMRQRLLEAGIDTEIRGGLDAIRDRLEAALRSRDPGGSA